jgi:sulfate adenylyltransferase
VISISSRTWADIEMIHIGGFAPLAGFLNRDDYRSVLAKCRLSDGRLWPIPITLAVNDETKKKLKAGDPVDLMYGGEKVAVLHVEDVFPYDKKEEARQVYKTEDPTHPGVAMLLAQPEYYVGGRIETLKLPPHSDFPQYNRTPEQTRAEIQKRKWKTVVGFQTRNPIHRAHEYITKCALETVDGLLIHPIVGETKAGDILAAVRMECYETLIKKYYQPNRVMLSINPSNMFYAGPREAVLHALVRKNYGCTHFIVGRDHAGVGGFYGPYEAHDFIRGFDADELGITPLCFENAFWSKKSGGMATEKTVADALEDRIHLSGTELRAMLASGKRPPPEFTRPEVADILLRNK